MADPTQTMLQPSPTGEGDGTLNIPRNSIPDAIRNAPHPGQAPQTFKVNGKDVQLTPDQIQEYVQKSAAADEKFREAAELRKGAERDAVLRQDLEAVIREGDVDAFRRMGAAMGLPLNEVETAAQKIWGDGSEDGDEWEDEEPSGRGQQQPQAQQRVDFSNLDPAVQRLLLQAEKDRIDKIIGQALDGSEKIKYNMGQYDEDGRKAVRSLVEEKVRGRLAATNGDFGDGSHILREILPEVESLLSALGSPRRQTPPLGMGFAPGGGDLEVYPKKQPTHVSSTSGSFEQHILESLMYHQAKAESGGR